METVTLSLPEAYALAMRALSANGFNEDHAAAVARNVTGGERDGCASHGLWRLLGIVDTLRKGKVSPDAGPLIGDMTSAESLAWDGGAGGLPYGGELILALDPQRFLGAEADAHLARAETLFNSMQAQGARLPGERRYLCRQESERQGVTISRSLFDEISALSE